MLPTDTGTNSLKKPAKLEKRPGEAIALKAHLRVAAQLISS
jgi:hypothetical protein